VAPNAAKVMGYAGPETKPLSTSPVVVSRAR